MASEVRSLTRRVGRYDTLDLDAYLALGGFEGLARAQSIQPNEVVEVVKQSGLSGRGGAGFPTGAKWESAAKEPALPKYIVCNADEGELGTAKDRVLMEGDPWSVLEGIAIAAYAIGASEAYIYLRGEYERAFALWERILEIASQRAVFGFPLHVTLARGRGLYIAGEELALLSSLEMRRPMSRLKPPYPTTRGLFGKPTVVNNVETLAGVALILALGVDEYRKRGTSTTPGTRLMTLSGDVKNPGVYEIEVGSCTIREVVDDLGGGTKTGRPLKAVQPGGGTTSLLAGEALDVTISPVAIRAAGSSLGTGAMIVYEEGQDAVEILAKLFDYYGEETCGRCFPCRIGMSRMNEAIARIRAHGGEEDDLTKLREIVAICGPASNCGLGQCIVAPVASALDLFPADFQAALEAAK